MPLKIIRQDITKIQCDAIVNPTDSHYSHGGGTDAAIHAVSGANLYRACLAEGELSIGQAVITPAFLLPCKHVIHTVGPVWVDGKNGEEDQLRSCYSESLRIAAENGCESVAFPLIASGRFGFPKDRVLKIAIEVIGNFLFDHEMLVYLVVYDKTPYSISEKLFSDIVSYLDDNCQPLMPPVQASYRPRALEECSEDHAKAPTRSYKAPIPPAPKRKEEPSASPAFSLAPRAHEDSAASLDDMLKNLDKGFADTLFDFIDEKGMTDVECYKRANVDKKTFSKIKCNKEYRPSKVTAVSFAIALHLNIDETNRLLNTVGMSLSKSNVFDVIITYFIVTGNYESIFDVNEVLYKFDQVTLGV